MKKSLIFLLFILLTFGLSGSIQAAVTGMCSHCHTMHNSQGGQQVVAFEAFEGYTDANPSLLNTTCVGCHSAEGFTISTTGTPIVWNIGGNFGTDDPLAGGNFSYVTVTNAQGHNVAGIVGQDQTLALIPPGGSALSSQLTCAGVSGCHGDRGNSDQLDAVRTAHHKDDSEGTPGGAAGVGLSYRFLNGISGTEDNDWEQDNVNTSHNEYKGANDFDDTANISSLCSQCHGDFHSTSGVGSGSPWLRHPTNIVLPTMGEYQYYNGGPGGGAAAPYSMIAPVARPDLSAIGVTSEARPGTDIVMCLSCHRVHGSPNFKMIRWDILNDFSIGCGVCHTSKQ
ncbi:MAG: hypothetical protein JRE23_01800 [Deltaproteobacteria bacterium]|nr:hypothetical protein [Deltaproteobacteria bacterium]